MKTMDHVKKRIIISMLSILLLIITLFGITYAYFTSRVKGNETEKVSFKAGKLALEYGDGNGMITAEKIIPGIILDTKTFTVKNTGTRAVENYGVVVQDVINDLINYEDLTYILTCKSYKSVDYENFGKDATETGTCDGTNDSFPIEDDKLVNNSIEKDMTHYYEITLTFNETNKDQSDDMKKRIEAKINIVDNATNARRVLVYGNSIQNGIPTPDTPVEIESVGDKTKNLLDINNRIIKNERISPTDFVDFTKPFVLKDYAASGYNLSSDIDFAISNNTITWTNSNGWYGPGFSFKPEKGKTYTVSYVTNNNVSVGIGYYSNGYFTRYVAGNTISLQAEETDVIVGLRTQFVENSSISNLQIEEGTEITEYEPYGKYKIPVTISGGNLISNQTLIENGFTLQDDGSYYVKQSDKPNQKVLYENKQKIQGSMTISFYTKFVVYNEYIGCFPVIYYTDGTTYSLGSPNQPTEFIKREYTTPENKTVDYIAWNYNTVIAETYIKDMQLKIGSDTEYEYYFKPVTYNVYLDEPLRKVGNYADYIDFEKGKIFRNIGLINLADVNWTTNANATGRYWANPSLTLDMSIVFPESNALISDFLCTDYEVTAYVSYSSKNNIIYSANTTNLIYIKDTNYKDLSSFKSSVKGTLLVQLKTPIEESVELPSVPMFKGTTVVEVDTKIKPSKIDIRY